MGDILSLTWLHLYQSVQSVWRTDFPGLDIHELLFSLKAHILALTKKRII